jgi:chromosome segregation protein
MKIKRLELSGFKSFVDRTIVNFEHEVMGIVGPNGCGKSNIVDAIRWAMGEQSAKHLRGRSMEDVIFNGSETRAGADMAEVTLTFENNTPDDVPLEYRDYADIAVTRRLYRTGESEYLINRTQVRLKDVTDLFLGTGVGTKAYSIVEQGKIGLIVSAKPEDRRLLIEEAAGITKFKSRKKQAEKKMELTQLNLLRVGDIVAEIERNLGTLKRQAAKAERYLSYRKEIEEAQLYEASFRYLELVGWIKLEQNQVEELTLEADGARSALVAQEADLETLRQEAHLAEEALELASNQNFAAENQVRTEEAAIERARDRFASLARREEQASAEAQELKRQHDALTAERVVLDAEASELEVHEGEGAGELASAEAAQDDVVRLHESAEAVAQEARQNIATSQAQIAAESAKLEGFERRKEDIRTRHERLTLQREDLETDRVALRKKAEQLALQMDDLQNGRVTSAEDREREEARLVQLKQEIIGSERALEDSRAELSRKRSRLVALSEIEARHEGMGAGVKSLVGTKDPSIVSLVADCVEAPHEYTAALAGLLGVRLQDVVVNDEDRGIALLSELAAARKGRATIISQHPARVVGVDRPLPDDTAIIGRLVDVLGFAPENEALVRTLVGDCVLVHNIAAATRLRAVLSCTIVTLDGTVLYTDGRISGGTGEDMARGVLETKREIRELTSEVQELDARVSSCLAVHQGLRGAIAEATGTLDRARQLAHERELAQVHTEKDLRALEGQLSTIERRIEAISQECTELAAQLEHADAEREASLEALTQAQAIQDEAQQRLAGAEDEAAGRKADVAAAREHVMERRVRVAGVREKLNAARSAALRLGRSAEEMGDRARRLDEELQRGAEEMGEIAAQLVKHKEALHLALDTARSAQEALAETRSVFDAFRSNLGEREGSLKDLRSRAETAREALGTHEMALRERQIALGHLMDGVAEKFRGLRLDRVIGDFHLRPPPDESTRARIVELGQLIDRMGSVNLEAMREHEDAEKRYAFYTEQKADLDRALADLEKAIQQMNRESKRLFEETFHAVNTKFQELFPKMFRGGRAALRLTNPEDMLETGIDILAQPPGKKLSSIELMSGGEKALTAVSLIFAIFQIKPSPFCILDEVDAPLDEANVARYNEAIRSMTDRSQFILITHIKRTMQMVDVLHGVTMQESGVSRLVSVKMDGVADNKLPVKGESRRHAPVRTKGDADAAAAATTEDTDVQVA